MPPAAFVVSYRGVMTPRGAVLLARWALLCALALGVVAMHHVGTNPGGHTGHQATSEKHQAQTSAGHQDTADDKSGSHGTHDALLHLCLAVLTALGGILLAVVFLGRRTESASRTRNPLTGGTGARAPPVRSGRDIKHLTCVIRV
ncbi:hypothetical protein BAY61_01555 [Prauserella marina]|nr:hypothetical protein BAY61_01555 [Prauserella marina]